MDEMPYTDKNGRIYKYGEFFPIEMSGLGYNETIANAYLPLTKDEALKKGFIWKDSVKKEFKVTMEAKDIPDDIKDVDESILKEVLGCMTCNEPFKLIPFELNFLQTNKIPIPRECFLCRHENRQRWKNPIKRCI